MLTFGLPKGRRVCGYWCSEILQLLCWTDVSMRLFLLEIIRTKEAPVMLAFLCSIYTKRLQHKLQPSGDIISSRSDYFLKKS